MQVLKVAAFAQLKIPAVTSAKIDPKAFEPTFSVAKN